MYGTHLSHTSGLAASAALCWTYARGQTNPVRWLMAVAGLAWSLLFLNRAYTALLFALPLGIDALFSWVRLRRGDQFARIALFASTALRGVPAYLAYNRLTTGDAFQATYLFYEPSEGLGFGPRRTQGMVVHHTLARGIGFFLENVLTINRWLLGFSASLFGTGLLALAGWSKRWSLLCLTTTVNVWLGYIGFWCMGIPDVGGPIYFFEMLAACAAHGARLGSALARRGGRVSGTWWPFCWSASCSAMGHTSARSNPHASCSINDSVGLSADRLSKFLPHALVFIKQFEFPEMSELVFNPRGLASDPLCVRSQYEDNASIQRLFRDRTANTLRGGGRPDSL